MNKTRAEVQRPLLTALGMGAHGIFKLIKQKTEHVNNKISSFKQKTCQEIGSYAYIDRNAASIPQLCDMKCDALYLF